MNKMFENIESLTELQQKLYMNILLVALDVHMMATGSQDMNPDRFLEGISLIQLKLSKWREGREQEKRFDDAVKEVLIAALIEAQTWKNSNE